MKRQPTELENILANYMSDRILISQIHKEFIQLSSKETNQLKNGQNT